jgi:hypothetical protein
LRAVLIAEQEELTELLLNQVLGGAKDGDTPNATVDDAAGQESRKSVSQAGSENIAPGHCAKRNVSAPGENPTMLDAARKYSSVKEWDILSKIDHEDDQETVGIDERAFLCPYKARGADCPVDDECEKMGLCWRNSCSVNNHREPVMHAKKSCVFELFLGGCRYKDSPSRECPYVHTQARKDLSRWEPYHMIHPDRACAIYEGRYVPPCDNEQAL